MKKKTFFDYDVPLDTYKSVLTIFSKSFEELPLSFVSKTKIDQNFETFQQQVFLKIRLNTENALFTTLPKTFLRKYKNFAARSPKRIETFNFFFKIESFSWNRSFRLAESSFSNVAKIFQKKDCFFSSNTKTIKKITTFAKKSIFHILLDTRNAVSTILPIFFPKIQTNFCFKVQTCSFFYFFLPRSNMFPATRTIQFRELCRKFYTKLAFFSVSNSKNDDICNPFEKKFNLGLLPWTRRIHFRQFGKSSWIDNSKFFSLKIKIDEQL